MRAGAHAGEEEETVGTLTGEDDEDGGNSDPDGGEGRVPRRRRGGGCWRGQESRPEEERD